ncbi:MAG: TPR end-of-group domain-containing protein [Opitutales bacterium]
MHRPEPTGSLPQPFQKIACPVPPKHDPLFDISFYEGVHRRCPAYTEVIELLGGLYTKTGRIADGLRMDRKLVRLQPDNATAYYNLACSLALSRRRADALRALHRAVVLGYDDGDWMMQDPDLAGLKEDPRFLQLLGQVKSER